MPSLIYKVIYNDKTISAKTIRTLCEKLFRNGYPTDVDGEPIPVLEYYEDRELFQIVYSCQRDIWYKVIPATVQRVDRPTHTEVRSIPAGKVGMVYPEYVFPDGAVYGEHTIMVTVPEHQVTVVVPSSVESLDIPEQRIPIPSTQGLGEETSED